MSFPNNNLIDVWTVFLPDCTPLTAECTRLLNAEETARAAAFRRPADQSRFILSRGILRKILGEAAGVNPAAVRFELNPNGKPFLPGSPLRFNLSHSRDRLLIAVTTGRAVGIDIEFRRSNINMAAIAERWFSDEERQYFQTAKTAETAFYDIWTKKEAFVKAQGRGIFQGISEFTVPLGTGPNVPGIGRRTEKPALPVPTIGKNGPAEPWLFQTLEIDPAYAAALVFTAPAASVQIRTL